MLLVYSWPLAEENSFCDIRSTHERLKESYPKQSLDLVTYILTQKVILETMNSSFTPQKQSFWAVAQQ
mgnify:CR=1 FL=1